LWDFVSGSKEYHNKLISMLRDVALKLLQTSSVINTINEKIDELLDVFEKEYSTVEDFCDTLW